jgi:hypothetical protein
MAKLLFDRGPEHQPIRWTAARGDGGGVIRGLATAAAMGVLIAPLAIGAAALGGLDHRRRPPWRPRRSSPWRCCCCA